MKQKRILSIIVGFLATLLIAACANTYENGTNVTTDTAETEVTTGVVAEGISYIEIDVKDYGPIIVQLDANAAPITVENFLSLVNEGFYDGLTFHRIINGFMIQGGDPEGTGMGGSDTQIFGEFASNGFENPISHTRGVISMARSMDPNSASSQFFIMHEDGPFLDGEYAAFGHVVEGMDIVDAIATDANPTDGNGTIARDSQPIITSIRVITYIN